MATTFLDQQNYFYDTVGDDTSSDIYPLANVKKLINEGEQKFIAEEERWFFLENLPLMYNTIADTTLSDAFTAGDADVDLTDSSTWPSASSTSYAAYIRGDLLTTWTGNAANQLTGAAGLQISHPAATAIKPMYAIPSTATKISQVFVDEEEFTYEPYQQWKSDKDSNYTIFRDFILLPENSGGEVLEVTSYKEAVELVDNTDESLLPEEFRLAPVYYALSVMYLATDEVAKSRSYCYFDPITKKFEGKFGELLYTAKKRYATRTARNRRKIRIHPRYR